MLETILLTGFGPFESHERNISQEAALRLDGTEVQGFHVRALALPVQFEKAVQLLEDALEGEQIVAIVASGISPEPQFSIELTAKNVREYNGRLDIDGNTVSGETVEADGPPVAISTLPVAAIKKAWEGLGLDAQLSDDAGTYLCNAVFYWAARRVNPAGFLHLPADPSALETVTAALEAAVDATATRLSAQRATATA